MSPSTRASGATERINLVTAITCFRCWQLVSTVPEGFISLHQRR